MACIRVATLDPATTSSTPRPGRQIKTRSARTALQPSASLRCRPSRRGHLGAQRGQIGIRLRQSVLHLACSRAGVADQRLHGLNAILGQVGAQCPADVLEIIDQRPQSILGLVVMGRSGINLLADLGSASLAAAAHIRVCDRREVLISRQPGIAALLRTRCSPAASALLPSRDQPIQGGAERLERQPEVGERVYPPGCSRSPGFPPAPGFQSELAWPPPARCPRPCRPACKRLCCNLPARLPPAPRPPVPAFVSTIAMLFVCAYSCSRPSIGSAVYINSDRCLLQLNLGSTCLRFDNFATSRSPKAKGQGPKVGSSRFPLE